MIGQALVMCSLSPVEWRALPPIGSSGSRDLKAWCHSSKGVWGGAGDAVVSSFMLYLPQILIDTTYSVSVPVLGNER